MRQNWGGRNIVDIRPISRTGSFHFRVSVPKVHNQFRNHNFTCMGGNHAQNENSISLQKVVDELFEHVVLDHRFSWECSHDMQVALYEMPTLAGSEEEE